MGPNTTDDKQQPLQATDSNTEAHAAGVKQPYDKRLHGNAFVRFLSGPYFDVIPIQFERATKARRNAILCGEAPDPNAEEYKDYLGQLTHLAMHDVDTDGKYGLNPDELVPLPFDVPLWPAYMVDVLAGMFQVAQATIVMFIAIYVENQDRSWKSGDGYTHSWLPVIKALIIVYPLITLIFLVNFTVEYCVRKFMYFRLLSMRILVDWENKQIWHTLFFYYFMATWVMMNAWALWGVAEYYGKFGNKGVDQTSFGTLVVVNLQTVQLLLYYLKLLSTESRLVSLNQIFERAPVEAQHLLEFTYVIEEEDLVQECYDLAKATRSARCLRALNLLTLGCLGRGWCGGNNGPTFSIDNLKKKAANYTEVEEKVRRLRERFAAPASQQKHEGAAGGDVGRPEQVTLTVEVHGGAASTSGGSPDGAAATPARAAASKGWGLGRWWYGKMYASRHSLTVAFMDHYNSWPFRPDVKYFRMLTFIQAFCVMAVGAIVVLGWFFSARDSTCAKSSKSCDTCLAVHERYFASSEPLCEAMEAAVSGIVASTTGTWTDNGVLEPRYCNFQCTGNFTASQSCPPAR